MSKLELHTSVEEIIECEDIPGFSIKKVNLGKSDFWTPLRTVYLSAEIPSQLRNRILETKEKSTLFQVNRVIYRDRSYNALNQAIQESDDEKITNILNVNEELSNENLSISLAFSDFPAIKMRDNFEDLLDYLHAFSSILFVPHVRYGDSKTKREYTARAFYGYVDEATSILKEKNTKPIFVPFDIDYDKKTRDELINYYARNGYTNIWIDFKGKVFSKRVIARMRILSRVIKKAFGKNVDDVILHLENIRKTPRESPADYKITPSDIIGAFSYGDVVGAPWKGIPPSYQQAEDTEAYWEKKGYQTKEEYDTAMFKRDCSIFENLSYYYFHPDKIQIKSRQLDEIREGIFKLGLPRKYTAEKLSYSISSILMLDELKQLRSTVESEGKLLDYIGDKEFFREDGVPLLKEVSKAPEKDKVKKKTKGLFDFID